jgi:hypothetical protein
MGWTDQKLAKTEPEYTEKPRALQLTVASYMKSGGESFSSKQT